MKILIISRSTWDNGNSFGNTFSNLFDGMDNVEIHNLCFQDGKLTSLIPKSVLRITEREVLKSIYKPSINVGEFIKVDVNNEKSFGKFDKIMKNAKSHKFTIMYYIRDLIWKFGRWKKSNILKDYLKGINPDIIYIPFYNSLYMFDIQMYVINLLNAPAVGNIMDDIYSLPKGFVISPLKYFYRKRLRCKVIKLVDKCRYLEVFAENMQKEYSQIFNKECYLIGKGVDVVEVPKIHYENLMGAEKECVFLYTGGIGDGRYKLLCHIANEIEKNQFKARIDIYTGTITNKKMEKELQKHKSINLKGFVTSKELINIRNNADYLVHVEGADKRSVYTTKMSFSTKIIDYLQTNKPIFAYGAEDVNSISVLKRHNIAVVANKNNLAERLCALIDQKIDLQIINQNVKDYLLEYRDIKKIQNGIYSRLKNISLKNRLGK